MAGHVAGSPVKVEGVRGGRFRFQIATRGDDAELRDLLRKTSMGGQVLVTMRREPSYFDAAAVEGPHSQVLTVRDISTDHLVGMGACSVRMRYVNGHPQPVGYLSGLRILPAYRRFGLLARGYRAFRELSLVSGTQFHLTTIADGNDRAIDVLTSGRAGLPHYHYLGRYYTFALSLQPTRRPIHEPGLEIRPACRGDLAPLVEHLQHVGRQLNGCPRYEETDFFHSNATFKNLRPKDILLAIRDDEIVGALGAWDQLAFRQLVVENYGRIQGLMRPLYNAWSRFRGRPRFPAVGQPSRHLMTAFPLARSGDTRILAALLDELRRRASRTKHESLFVGVYERDTLRPFLHNQACFTYVTRVYLVSWGDDQVTWERARDQNLYLELGCL